ncbi:MAG: DNA primase [Oscillospiraceae bacterium]|nr:DNA primase [Oscillospiraceae bacterium]
MAIPDSFLEELNARTDIVDLVSGYVSLTKKGNRYWGLCPFHSEKTPSFSVAPDRQMCYCFGCHKGGGPVNFIMELEGVGFVDAVSILAQRAGMPMPETKSEESSRKRRERLYELNKAAARYFYQNLMSPAGRKGMDYFRERGLSRKTIRNFGLGYSLGSWDALIKAMAELGYSKQELLDVGLVVKSEKGSIYDRFRGRVMFPIIDLRGNVIGFGGRVLDDSTPKYLNSPDTIIYNKSKNLFALNLAKKSKQERLILTEGYMDTIALHQAGFDCAIASLGTSLTSDHARMIAQRTQEVVLSYDSDKAGINAAQRAIQLLNKTGVRVKVLKVTGAKDPDEFIKKYGAAAFQKLIDGSENQMEFRILQVKNQYDLTQDDQRVACIQELAALIAHLPGSAEREVYGNRAAKDLEISPETMQREIQRSQRRQIAYEKKQQARKVLQPVQMNQPESRALRYDNMRSGKAEEGVIALLLNDPGLMVGAAGLAPEDFTVPLFGRVYQIIRERWAEDRPVSLNVLGPELTGEEMNHIASILQSPISQSNRDRAMEDYINIIHTQQLKGGDRSGLDDEALMAYRDRKGMEEQK